MKKNNIDFTKLTVKWLTENFQEITDDISNGDYIEDITFEKNISSEYIRETNSIKKWEPRIAIQQITVSSTVDKTILNSNDLQQDLEHILFIRIVFIDPENIKEVCIQSFGEDVVFNGDSVDILKKALDKVNPKI